MRHNRDGLAQILRDSHMTSAVACVPMHATGFLRTRPDLTNLLCSNRGGCKH